MACYCVASSLQGTGNHKRRAYTINIAGTFGANAASSAPKLERLQALQPKILSLNVQHAA